MGSAAAAVENLVVIGSGPAGYTAALYAARANLSPLLITGYQDGGIPGGQLMTTTHVENFPGFPDGILGPELMDRMKSQAVRWGTRLIEADADALDLTERPYKIQVDGQTVVAHSVILATGASANRLHIDGEDTYWSRGISACAICDGATPQFRKAELAVVGGGDSAVLSALDLVKKSSSVHLSIRSSEYKARPDLVELVEKNAKINVIKNSLPLALEGDDRLRSVSLQVGGRVTNVDCEKMVVKIGYQPNTELFRGQVELDSRDHVVVDSDCQSSRENVFVAGDIVHNGQDRIAYALGSGIIAARAARRALGHNI